MGRGPERRHSSMCWGGYAMIPNGSKINWICSILSVDLRVMCVPVIYARSRRLLCVRLSSFTPPSLFSPPPSVVVPVPPSASAALPYSVFHSPLSVLRLVFFLRLLYTELFFSFFVIRLARSFSLDLFFV